jgi:hypothetical protein
MVAVRRRREEYKKAASHKKQATRNPLEACCLKLEALQTY